MSNKMYIAHVDNYGRIANDDDLAKVQDKAKNYTSKNHLEVTIYKAIGVTKVPVADIQIEEIK